MGLWEVRGSNLNGDKKMKKEKKKKRTLEMLSGASSQWVGSSTVALRHLFPCHLTPFRLVPTTEEHTELHSWRSLMANVGSSHPYSSCSFSSVHVYMCLRNCGTWWSHRWPVFHFWVIFIQLIRYLCHKFIIEGWCHIIQDRKPL